MFESEFQALGAHITALANLLRVPGGTALLGEERLRVGLGAERKFNANWSGYGELSYTDFGDVDAFGGANIDSQKIKLGVNYRF